MKVYKLLSAICLYLCLFAESLNAQNSNNEFKIAIKLKNVPDCQIMVAQDIPDPQHFFVDTLNLKKGKIVYKGAVDYPCLLSFIFNNESNDFIGSFNIFVDNSEDIEVTGELNKRLKIKGKNISNKFIEWENQIQPLLKDYHQQKDNNINNYISILKRITELPDFATNPVSGYYIYKYFMGNTEWLEKALNKISSILKDNKYIVAASNELERQKNTAIGKKAYNFSLNDIYGKTYHLSDYKGKYVLLEFSASWCGWCKKEIPFLKQIYTEYKNHPSFEIITVNLDDKKEDWEQDVKEYKLPWPVISDLTGFKGKTPQAYNIHGIPMIYLIDKKGNIIEKNLRGQEMINSVKKYLDKEDKTFTINGITKDFNNGYVYIYDDTLAIDSCKIISNHYSLHGKIKENKQFLVQIKKPNYDYGTVFFAYIQPGTMKIETIPYKRFYKHLFYNAPIQNQIDSIQKHLNTLKDFKEFNKTRSIIQEEFMKNSTAPQILKDKQSKLLYNSFNQLFISKNANYNEALGYIIEKYSGLLNEEQIMNLYNRFDSEIQKTYYLSKMIDNLKRDQKVAKGKKAPDFALEDLKGNKYTLESFKGKYIFLEFSASWCGWCKKEIPYIKKAYNTFKNKNIVFVTVMMDEKKNLWENEIKKYSIPWLSLSDLKGIKYSSIAKEYNITGVPVSFLIDPNGIIIEKDLRGDDVIKTIENIIKE